MEELELIVKETPGFLVDQAKVYRQGIQSTMSRKSPIGSINDFDTDTVTIPLGLKVKKKLTDQDPTPRILPKEAPLTQDLTSSNL